MPYVLAVVLLADRCTPRVLYSVGEICIALKCASFACRQYNDGPGDAYTRLVLGIIATCSVTPLAIRNKQAWDALTA
ncbi:hypothetical protein AA103196_1129 [Ameyamaea chiangmaiensis NBRC 103196]|uniref:Uncharacterized protein n=1 Tax=Ameyamaea chiangmaiensis TaxID=442969 RepID=A0A850PHT2_9PROT|nr:hypothetical protein [Ameyamaea chiangmaiensis]MBS4075103.1 hypothetical protein [Ameyamaea chiangmaiensis]NVN41392.1 hypothetical protein [Ameyamaea chiangmaiensis]GBQ65457.1 hypothetical protein AA103196_1129 [Ameyamaea chiangmaiensis NBRC 103196]